MKYLLLTVAMTGACYSYAQTAGSKSQLLYDQGIKVEKKNALLAIDHFREAYTAAAGGDVQIQSLIKLMQLVRDPASLDSLDRWVKNCSVQLTSRGREDSLAADFFFETGNFYDGPLSQTGVAMEGLNRALKIRLKLYSNLNEAVAACYHRMADIYKYSEFDFTHAEKFYEKALTIREKIPPGDFRPLARNYYSLATTNRSQQDYEKAVSYALKAIDLIKKMNDGLFLQRAYSITANIFRDMSDFTKANEYYSMAIELNRSMNGKKVNEDQAWNYRNYGESLLKQKNYTAAIRSFEETMKIYAVIPEITDRRLYIYSYQKLGDAYALTGRADDADQMYRKAIRFSSASGGQPSQTYKSIADLFESKGNLDSAQWYYQKALQAGVPGFNSFDYRDNPSFEAIDLKENVYDVLLAKGKLQAELFGQRGDKKMAWSALDCFILAEKLLTSSRNSLDMEEAKWSFVETNFDLYESSLTVLYNLSKGGMTDSVATLAYKFFEGSKSKTLADGLAAAEYVNPEIFSDSLLSTRNDYKMSLLVYHDRVKRSKNETESGTYREKIVDLDRRIDSIERAIDLKYPNYLSTKYEYQFPSLQSVRGFGETHRATILHYFWGDEFVYGLAIGRGGLQFKRIGRSDSLALKINSLLNHFKLSTSAFDRQTFLSFSKNSFQLYQALLGSFYDGLPSGNILIIPDGLIGLVPFDVLTSTEVKSSTVDYKRLTYLVQSTVVGYAFSVSTMMKSGDVKMTNPYMLAFGYSGGSEFRGTDSAYFSNLSGSGIELESLAKRFPSGKFLSDRSANESNFKQLAPEGDLLHLAVHGTGSTEKDFSGSLFFIHSDTVQDGELHWYELYGLKLKAFLAVLSSCESGVGKSYKGEGMLSMANAFAHSGCQNIVMGLWKVNDRVSVRLMDDFYEGVDHGLPIPEALTWAKRKYLLESDELTSDPRLWGALVAYGNKRMIKDSSLWKPVVLVTISLIFFLTLVLRNKIRKGLKT